MKRNLFNSVKITPPRRNSFDLSHDVKMTTDMGRLAPCMIQEALPGDTFVIGSKTLIRFAPLIAPVMHRMDVRIEYYFYPNRVAWPGWEDFITGEDALRVHPYVEYNRAQYDANKLYDYLGLPRPGAEQTVRVSAFPFCAYQNIWKEYYRDQNLQVIDKEDFVLVDGDNSANTELFILRHRAWEHDYFTSALPFAQKGEPVDLPLGTVERVPNTNAGSFRTNTDAIIGTEAVPSAIVNFEEVSSGDGTYQLDQGTGTKWKSNYDPEGTLEVQPTTINELRTSWSIQRFLELLARVGSRYAELLKGFFGVRPQDARLDRPEYIVGVKSPVIISEVLNNTGQVTEGEDPGLPQGNMSGHGMTVLDSTYARYNVQEHGFIIGVTSIIPLTAYQQGLPRHYIYNDRLDYYWQQFDHLGEQTIQNREVYIESADPEGDFGYTPRYSHLKYTPSRVAGDFKTSKLDFWHLGRIFDTEPALNADFVQCIPDKRIFAVTEPNLDSIYCQILHQVQAIRPMSRYSTPM